MLLSSCAKLRSPWAVLPALELMFYRPFPFYVGVGGVIVVPCLIQLPGIDVCWP